MIYLTQTEAGFSVWDGVYERYLDKDSRSIWKTRLAKPPPRSPLTDVSFEALAFQHFVTLEKRWEESSNTDGWLQVILECAREIDVLTNALLDRVDRCVHEADFQSLPVEDSQWYIQHASIDGRKGRIRGQLLSCIWGDNDCGLWLFGEGKFGLCHGPSPKFMQGGFGVLSRGTVVSLVNPGSCTLAKDFGDERIELSWDEAILECAKWMQQKGAVRAKCDGNLASMLLAHRRKRFSLALHLARLGGSRSDFKSAFSTQSETCVAENAEKRVNELAEDLEACRKRSEELTSRLKEVGETCVRLTMENDLMHEKLEDQQSNVMMLKRGQEQIKALQQELVEAQSQGGRVEELDGLLAECMSLRTEVLNCQKNSSELRWTQKKVIELERKLETSQDRIKSMEKEWDSLLRKLSDQRNASWRRDGGSLNGQCSVLPSASEFLQDCQAVKQKLLEFYFDHFRRSISDKVRFGTCIATLVTGMHNVIREAYDEYVSGLTEVLTCTQEAAKSAMEFHCRENWTKLFLHESYVDRSHSRLDRKQKSKEKVDWNKEEVYDPFDFGSDDDDGTSESSESENEADWKLLDGQCRSHTAIQVDALHESVIKQFQVKLLSDEELTKLRACFDELWRITVILFLQNPEYRFCGSCPRVEVLNGEKHQSVDLEIKPREQVVILIPPVMRASQPGSSAGCGSTNHPKGWTIQESALVDSFD